MISRVAPAFTAVAPPAKARRGVGRGAHFFVLDRGHWERLWAVETVNRLNLVTAFLVLLAGTGADHRLTKWSAKACEDKAGMGKPRAKLAIAELIAGGLAERTGASRPAFPQYRLAAPGDPREPIFLPVALVTGLDDEPALLRRVRETGDALLLRLLVDMYGLVQTDATHGLPLVNLRRHDPSPDAARKVAERGANAVWELRLGAMKSARGDWCVIHATGDQQTEAEWQPFWDRFETLLKLDAFWFEPWVFDGDGLDAEPLFPLPAGDWPGGVPEDVSRLGALAWAAAAALLGEDPAPRPADADRVRVVLPAHHRRPALRGVARLRVEPDTPGRRLAQTRRGESLARHIAAYGQVIDAARAARYDRPIRAG